MVRGVYIGLGSNLGDREATIRAALRDLEQSGDVRVLRCSRLRETEAMGGPPGQGKYLNAVAELETGLSPEKLLERMLGLEQAHGRVRAERNAARTLDLDLLLYPGVKMRTPALTLPHPRMWERDFVLGPLGELVDPGELERRRSTG